jgi:hypothetical protein
VTSDPDGREGREAWTDLRSVVLIASERFLGDALSVERRSSSAAGGTMPGCGMRRSAAMGVWGIRGTGCWT